MIIVAHLLSYKRPVRYDERLCNTVRVLKRNNLMYSNVFRLFVLKFRFIHFILQHLLWILTTRCTTIPPCEISNWYPSLTQEWCQRSEQRGKCTDTSYLPACKKKRKNNKYLRNKLKIILSIKYNFLFFWYSTYRGIHISVVRGRSLMSEWLTGHTIFFGKL